MGVRTGEESNRATISEPEPEHNPNPKHKLSNPSVHLPLLKQLSWSPDTDRDEAWLRRKSLNRSRRSRSRSVTDEDLDELRGCIDLGFRFGSDSPDRLSRTFPALDLYFAVHGQHDVSVARSSPSDSTDGSPIGSPLSIYTPGDSPEVVKARLKQWAQVVACSVRQRC